MLYQLVERICTNIKQIDLPATVPDLSAQLQRYAPDSIRAFSTNNQMTEDASAKMLATLALGFIKSSPSLARRLTSASQDRSKPAALRAAIASILVYFVQPHDLIPDDAAGAYGLLDDTVLLRAGYVEYLRSFPTPDGNEENETKAVNFLVYLCPEQTRAELVQGINSMGTLVQILGMMGSDIAEGTLTQMIGNPLAFTAPGAPQGFTARQPTGYSQGSWSGGAYFEGGNVIIPGGPSLINGQLFIPS